MLRIWMLFLSVFCSLFFVSSSSYAIDNTKVMEVYESKIKSWLHDPIVINALKAQNEKHAALAQADIDKLDGQWRAEDVTLIDPVLNNALSKYLQTVVSGSEGMYSEIFVMDNKGLNVGQSAKTSDYWQGDEPKFQETFGKGVDDVHVGEVEFDESSQSYQTQLSVRISDGGTPIGAVTIGINAEILE